MINRKNIPLVIALGIPVLMIILVAAFIYLPGIGKKPEYDFLYSSGSGYSVEDGSLVPPIHADYLIKGQPPYQDPQLYIYNVKTNSAQAISYTDAENLKLDSSQISADGYTVEQGSNYGAFPFGGSYDYNSWYIEGHNRAFKLNLQLNNPAPYYGSFQFLGWINQ